MNGQWSVGRSHVPPMSRLMGRTWRVTWTDDVELRGILGLLEPLMGRMVRRGTRPTSAS